MEVESCCEVLYVPEVLVEARGRKANFLNPDRVKYHRITVDGCVSINAIAADFIVSKCEHADVVVELKGRDIEHAVVQIEATLTQWRNSKHRCPKIGALVVSNQVPKATIVQKVLEKFVSKFNVPIKVSSGNRKYRIEELVR